MPWYANHNIREDRLKTTWTRYKFQELTWDTNPGITSNKPTYHYILDYGDFIYRHNWSLQLFSEEYDLASDTNYVACFNFINNWRDLQFKVDFEWQIIEKLFMAILFALGVFARNLLRGSCPRNNIYNRHVHQYSRKNAFVTYVYKILK